MVKRILGLLLALALVVAVAPLRAEDDGITPEQADSVPDYIDYASREKPAYVDPVQASNVAMLGSSGTNLGDAINRLSRYYLDYYRKKGPAWLQNTNIDYTWSFNNSGYLLDLQTVQPLLNYDEESETMLFCQGRLNYSSGNQTVLNAGIGYRILSSEFDILYGINAFYDAGFYQTSGLPANFALTNSNYSHQRIGLGLENFIGAWEGRFNAYLGISPAVELGRTADNWAFMERAATGMDAEVGGYLPFATWLSVYGKGYYYFKEYNALNWNGNDLCGFTARAAVQATPQLNLEVGADFNNGSVPVNYYGKLSFNLLALPKPALYGGNEAINSTSRYNLQNKLLQPVLRNNDIVVERFTKDLLDPGSGGVMVTVYKYGQVVSGERVFLLKGNSQNVIADEYTDDNGQAYFSGVQAGSGYYVALASSSSSKSVSESITLSNTSNYFSVSGDNDSQISIEAGASGDLLLTLQYDEGSGPYYVKIDGADKYTLVDDVTKQILLTDIACGLKRIEIATADSDDTVVYLSAPYLITGGINKVTIAVPTESTVAAAVNITYRTRLPAEGIKVDAYVLYNEGSESKPLYLSSVSTGNNGTADFTFYDYPYGEFFFLINLPGGSIAKTDPYLIATGQKQMINYTIQ